MKWIEIKNKSKQELQKDLAHAKTDIVDLRFKAKSGSLKQVHLIGKARKQISHILTRLYQIKHNDKSKKSE
jgi:ribosomal protein L29